MPETMQEEYAIIRCRISRKWYKIDIVTMKCQ